MLAISRALMLSPDLLLLDEPSLGVSPLITQKIFDILAELNRKGTTLLLAEQNAALARAVIGGLLFATPTTLFVVPYLFAVLRKRNDGKPAQGVFAEDPQ